MKNRLLLFIVTLAFTAMSAYAADFKVNGIAYYITSSTAPYTVAVASDSIEYTGDVIIPDSVEFNSIKYSVTAIGSFGGFHSLTSINIPNSVTTIGAYTFSDCINLKSIVISNSVTRIEHFTFDHCLNLTSVVIPNSVTSIGLCAFRSANIKSINIPNSVTEILRDAFSSPNLTSINIPNSVTYIGQDAFCCENLSSIYEENPIPTYLEHNNQSSVFLNVNKSTCILYVPKGSKSLYAAAYEWKDFLNIVEKEYTGIQDNVMQSVSLFPNPTTQFFTVQGLYKETSIQIFDLTGKKVLEKIMQPEEKIDVAKWSKGIYVIKVEGRTAKLVVK